MNIISIIVLLVALVFFANANFLIFAARWGDSKVPQAETYAEAQAYFVGAFVWFVAAWALLIFFNIKP